MISTEIPERLIRYTRHWRNDYLTGIFKRTDLQFGPADLWGEQ